MPRDELRGRIADQFSYREGRSDVWRAFDLFLDTDAFLNLGYSAWYQPLLLGSSQRRLVDRVGSALASRLPCTAGVPLLDVGCGRGGPSVHLAERYGFRVAGVDLVPYNVARARANAAERGADAEFVVADATRLPIRPGSVAAAVSIDALVYLPEKDAVFEALSAALSRPGVAVFSDLVARPSTTDRERRRLDRFADAWDMPPLSTLAGYERALVGAGFSVRAVTDVTPNSVGRFRRWTTLYLGLSAGPAGPLLDRLLREYGLDPPTMDGQIRAAHEALPSLRHVIVVAEVR